MFRVVDEVTPVAMLHRPAPRQDRRHTSRAIAEHGVQPAAVGGKIAGEGVLADDFPAASVDHYKEREDRFHDSEPVLSRSRMAGRPPNRSCTYKICIDNKQACRP